MSDERPDGQMATRAIVAMLPNSREASALMTAMHRYQALAHQSRIEMREAKYAATDLIATLQGQVSPELRISIDAVIEELKRCPICSSDLCEQSHGVPLVWQQDNNEAVN